MGAIDYPVPMTAEQNRRIAAAIERERRRLTGFIRRRVPDRHDAEDLLQEVFSELVEAYRLMQPIEHVGAWLFRVARNRITDLFRRRSSMPTAPPPPQAEDDRWQDLLPSADGGPEAMFARAVLLDELDAALDELPPDQRAVFVAHEIEGRTFQQLAEELGIGINTLLARKHYAVRHLRKRLAAIHAEYSQP